MEPFKQKLDAYALKKIAQEIKAVAPSFDAKNFLKNTISPIEDLELKERVQLIATQIHQNLPLNFPQAAQILQKTLADKDNDLSDQWESSSKEKLNGFLVWPLTQFIENYGLDFFEESMQALYEMTQRFTAEFALRSFLDKHYHKTYKRLQKWKKDPSHHVRRLVSESTRPKLPWAKKVDHLLNNLNKNIDLLLSLKNDPSLYVRRSVANHLNDISYLDEKLFIKTLSTFGHSKNEQWIKRHASRTLLKKGNPQIFKMHGYDPTAKLELKANLSPKNLYEGEKIKLKLQIKNLEKNEKKILIDYVIYYLKKNGNYSPKTFRVKDTFIKESIQLEKVIHLKKVTTRKHYSGKHYLEIKMNGKSHKKLHFFLKHS
ncbi:MAG: hypothetical protein QF441_05925 [Bacteriovoracaceae bacterium]|jgi:3-methyladenine DNA glycosylase AlkC|nr:hypothetical protein [Bacteriovoracaceae bacterium]